MATGELGAESGEAGERALQGALGDAYAPKRPKVTSDRPVRMGIIGTGAIAAVHAKVISDADGAELTFVKGGRRENAMAFAKRFNAELVDDVDRLLDGCDAVVISCPGHAHAAYTLAALDAGKAVLSEKPGATNLRDARQIAERVKRGGVYQLGLNRRHAPVYRRLRHMLEHDTNATSYQARINRGELEQPSWVADPRISGGYGFETVIHLIDLMRFLFGDIRRLEVSASSRVYPDVDNMTFLFEHTNGVHGSLTSCAHATWMPPYERVEVFGRQVTICTEELDQIQYRFGLGGETRAERFDSLPEEERGGFDEQLRLFLARLGGRSEAAAAGADDLVAAVEILTRVYGESR